MTAAFLRAFAPTETDPERLGLQPLATGRKVYRTGKVDIGLLACEARAARDHGADATLLQDLMRLPGEWPGSATVDDKIRSAPGVFARLVVWAMGGA